MTGANRTVTGSGFSATQARKPPPETRLRALLQNERLMYGATGVIGFLILWEVGARTGAVRTEFFASPILIAQAGVQLVQEPRFWDALPISIYEFAMGFGLAVIIGIPLGLAAGWFTRLNYALDPWMNFFNALPRVALIPVLVIMFGVLGPEVKIAVVFLGAFISVLIVTVQGVRTVDRRYLDVATSFRASQRRLFTSVIAYSTVPFIIAGLRLGLARGLIGVVTAEVILQTGGLAVLIRRFSEARQPDKMLFVLLIFTTAGIVGVQLIKAVERRYQQWRPEQEL